MNEKGERGRMRSTKRGKERMRRTKGDDRENENEGDERGRKTEWERSE